MKCPNCGADLPGNGLYCEQCGEDIHIVPDFDAEVEEHISQTIQEIVNNISESDVSQSNHSKKKSSKTMRTVSLAISMLGILILIVVISITSIKIFQYNSFDYQVEKAKQSTQNQQYEKAMAYYLRALELEPDNVPVKFSLSEIYFLKENKIEYEHLLRDIVHSSNATEEELNSAYGKLIAIYRGKKDFKTIHELILSSNNDIIISAYQDYIARDPEFSLRDGYYNDVQPLKISGFGTGKIFYTINGEDPDESSLQYTAPIILDEGDYIIKAVFLNELGIYSNIKTAEFHVMVEAYAPPQVSAVSGDYEFPIMIEVLEDDNDIYYTTDGTDPSLSSIPYAGPIPMPLGSSEFKFIKIAQGKSSEITTRKYQLTMHTQYMPEDAIQDILQYAISCGRIINEAGQINNSDSTYSYLFQYVANINQIDDFYVISEFQKDADGFLSKTGNNYAVNAYTGYIYKLQIDTGNNYTLVEIQVETQD